MAVSATGLGIAPVASAFSVFASEADYNTALSGASLTTTISDGFSQKIQADTVGSSITLDAGIVSSIINSSNTNQNRVVASEFQGNLRDAPTNREITWTLPTNVNAFSLEIQGATPGQNLTIQGLLDGPDGGTQSVNLSQLFGNASYNFIGIIGMGEFDAFTFLDDSPGDGSNAFNFKVDNFSAATSTPIPTPALLPAVVGFGVSVLRKQKKQNVSVDGVS